MSYYFSARNLVVFWLLFAGLGGGLFLVYTHELETLDASNIANQATIYGLMAALTLLWSYLLSVKQEAVYAFYSSYDEHPESLDWRHTPKRSSFFLTVAPAIALGLVYHPTLALALTSFVAIIVSFPALARYLAVSGPYGARESEVFFNYSLMLLIAAYIPVQMWFNAAMINTIASDENLVYNTLVADVSLIFASVGISIHVVRTIGRPIEEERFSIARLFSLPVQFPFLILRWIGVRLNLISENRHFGWKAITFFMIAGTFTLFFVVQGAVSFWAAQQSTTSKSAALIGMLGRTAMINQFGVPGEADEFKTPERVRLELLYMPAVFAMSDLNDIAQVRSLVSRSDYVRDTFNSVHVIPATQEGFQNAKKDLEAVWDSYTNYLQLVGTRMSSEAAANRLIAPLAGRQRMGETVFVPGKNRGFLLGRRQAEVREANPHNVRTQNGFTCLAKADFVMESVVREASTRTSLMNFDLDTMGRLMSRNRARSALTRSLREEGVRIPWGWTYTNNDDMRKMIADGICEAAEEGLDKFESLTGVSIPDNPNAGNVLSLEQYMRQVTGVSIGNVRNLDFNQYQDLIQSNLGSMSTNQLLQEATNRVSTFGDDWIRAAVMPVVGVTSSLLVMFFNLGYLVYKGLMMAVLHFNKKKWNQADFNQRVRRITGSIVASVFVAAAVYHSEVYRVGVPQGFLNVQETVFRVANFQLSRAGYPPSLSVQSEAYKKEMAEHHLRRAEVALQNNRLTTPPSRSTLFHVMMAKYHWSEVNTNQILDAVIDRYLVLGADNPESTLYDRLQYIKTWDEIYRL